MKRILPGLLAVLGLMATTAAQAYPVTADPVLKDQIRHGSHITLHGVWDGQ